MYGAVGINTLGSAGVVTKASRRSLPETLDRLETVIRAKGLVIFMWLTTAERRRSASKCRRLS